MPGDDELKKIKKHLQRNREEIAELQRRIQFLIEKRRGGFKKSDEREVPRDNGK